MPGETLQDVYVEQLKDLYSAEQQILKALPKMAKAVTHAELRRAFQEHEVVTRTHVERTPSRTKRSSAEMVTETCSGCVRNGIDGAEAQPMLRLMLG